MDKPMVLYLELWTFDLYRKNDMVEYKKLRNFDSLWKEYSYIPTQLNFEHIYRKYYGKLW